jgi:septal ring-binding cell division protein DamX
LINNEVNANSHPSDESEKNHPLDFVKPTHMQTSYPNFWNKHAVKILSVALLVLVFIFLSHYEHMLHQENISNVSPLPQAIVSTPSLADAPPAAPVSSVPVLPAKTDVPSIPSIQITKDLPDAPEIVSETKTKPQTTPPVMPAVTPKPVSPQVSLPNYHWQVMASLQASHVAQAQEKLSASGLKPFVLTKEVKGKTWYTLNIGSFSTKDEAQAMLKQIQPSLLKQKWWLVKAG